MYSIVNTLNATELYNFKSLLYIKLASVLKVYYKTTDPYNNLSINIKSDGHRGIV